MLKHDLLSILTIEQWAKFKRFVSDRNTPVFKDSDGVGHPDFLLADVHEFLTTEGKYDTSKTGSDIQEVKQVDNVPDRGATGL